MIKNYLKTAYRILTRNKAFSIINIFGMSVALTSVLVIFLFVSNELSFDKHHSNFNRIYRVVNKELNNGKQVFHSTAPVPVGEVLRSDLTSKEHVTQIYFTLDKLVRVNNEKFLESGLMYVDTLFHNVFDVNVIIGDLIDLNKPNQIFLRKELATKYFGSPEKALNQEIIILDSVRLNIAGILEENSENTHLNYKALISWETISNENFSFDYNDWGTRNSSFGTYISLKENASLASVENQINQLVKEHNPDYDDEETLSSIYSLQALKEIHFDDRFNAFAETYVISKKILWIIISVGIFILAIAFVNFINLSIVQIIKRAREVGIRKVLGAHRRMLIKQFLGETFLLLLITEIISLIVTEVILDKVNLLLGSGINLQLYADKSIILFLVIVLVSLTFLSGTYPAMVLSRYNPIKAIRYNFKVGQKKSFSLYNILIVFQFVISLVLIVSATVFTAQVKYLSNKDLGFDKENIVNINLPQGQIRKSEALKDLLKNNPKVQSVSLGIGAPLTGSNITSSFQLEGDLENNFSANVKTVDSTYKKLYKLEILAGQWYRSYHINDSTFNIVVNKSFLKEINVNNTKDVLGTFIRVFGSIKGHIVGVVDDFHAYSLHNEIPPVIFLPYDEFFHQMSVKTNNIPYSEIEPFIEQCWEDIFPEYIYTYTILEESIDNRYNNDKRISRIILVFTFIAIVIACMGLFGLVSFMLMQRTKEIGLRKALGASVVSLISMISIQFLKLVAVACIVSWPLAYFLMDKWLENYAFKIQLNIWIFLLSGLILLAITFLTILYQSIKVSLTNPVDVLKYE